MRVFLPCQPRWRSYGHVSHVRRSSLVLCSLIALASGVGALGAGSVDIPQQPATVEHALGLIASGDYKSARSELTALAEVGAFRADYYLGLMMQSGQGGVADPAAALGYYESATELGGSEPVEAPGLRSRLPAAPRPADDAVVARFGRDAVARRLSERVLAAAMVPVDPKQRPPLWLTGPRMEKFYPRSAARRERAGVHPAVRAGGH